MDKQRIEMIVALNPAMVQDEYGDRIVEMLTPPKWYHPIKRQRWMRKFPLRVRVIMAEYAKELISAIVPQTQTTAPTPQNSGEAAVSRPQFTVPGARPTTAPGQTPQN